MKKRKHIMRVYAGIISVIAIVSIAANISFGYYLYAFEQLNRQLQRQIVNFQQDQADDAQQIYALDTALRVNRSYVRWYLRANLHHPPHATYRGAVGSSRESIRIRTSLHSRWGAASKQRIRQSITLPWTT
jgi:hypothetical protein